jgi:hypothetical protein
MPLPPSNFLKIHFNITLPSTFWSSKSCLSLRFLHQNFVCTCALLHICYMPHVGERCILVIAKINAPYWLLRVQLCHMYFLIRLMFNLVLCTFVVQAVTSHFVIANCRYIGDCERIVPKYSSQKKLPEFRPPCC